MESDNTTVTTGEQTRQVILQHAVDIASREGLEGLTIGRLSKELGMSKSGIFAHFGSKTQLQLATVNAAGEIFAREVMDPYSHTKRGLQRLKAMLECWVSYVERRVFQGGCFFFAASAEFDGRPGEVRDRVAELTKGWLDAIVDEIRIAQKNGQLSSSVKAEQLAFELHALVQEANWAYELLSDSFAYRKARTGIAHRLSRTTDAHR